MAKLEINFPKELINLKRKCNSRIYWGLAVFKIALILSLLASNLSILPHLWRDPKTQHFHRKTNILTVLLFYHGVLIVSVFVDIMEMFFLLLSLVIQISLMKQILYNTPQAWCQFSSETWQLSMQFQVASRYKNTGPQRF